MDRSPMKIDHVFLDGQIANKIDQFFKQAGRLRKQTMFFQMDRSPAKQTSFLNEQVSYENKPCFFKLASRSQNKPILKKERSPLIMRPFFGWFVHPVNQVDTFLYKLTMQNFDFCSVSIVKRRYLLLLILTKNRKIKIYTREYT